MMKKQLIAAIVTVPLVVSAGVAAASAVTTTVKTPNTPTTTVAKSDTLSITTRTVKGTMKTKRYIPRSFKYSLKVPTLNGVDAKVKKAFDKRINALINRELRYYAKGAVTKTQFNELVREAKGAVSASDYRKLCRGNFEKLKGQFTSALYKGRYASVVVTFSGLNAACNQLGGLWVGYQTDRSVTIDTQTGQFKKLTDFTSNSDGKVTAAVKAWYGTISHEHLTKSPKVSKTMKVCDRPGNVITAAINQKRCYFDPYYKTGLVAWQVRDDGLQLTFPASDGLRYALLDWKQIPSS